MFYVFAIFCFMFSQYLVLCFLVILFCVFPVNGRCGMPCLVCCTALWLCNAGKRRCPRRRAAPPQGCAVLGTWHSGCACVAYRVWCVCTTLGGARRRRGRRRYPNVFPTSRAHPNVCEGRRHYPVTALQKMADECLQMGWLELD